MLSTVKIGGLTCILVVAIAVAADAQVFSDDFESGSASWTLDPAVGGVAWAVDGTPAAPFLMFGCGGFTGGDAPIAFGANALNWNNGTDIDAGITTAGNSALGPVITVTSVAGVTLTFDDYYEMTSCLTTEATERHVDIMDAAGATVLKTLFLTYADAPTAEESCAPFPFDGISDPVGNWADHHTHTVDLSTIGATSFRIRFRVVTTSAATGIEPSSTGWFVDNVLVVCPDAILPSAPALIGPADGACSTSPVLLDWTDSTDTTSCGPGAIANYDIDVATDAGFVTIVASGTFTASSVLFAAPAATYFWRVRSRDLTGNVSAFTVMGSFVLEVALAPTFADTLHVNESTQTAQTGNTGFVDPVLDETPVFSAIFRDPNCGDFAAQFRFQVSSDPTFATLDFDSGLVALSPLLPIGARCPDVTIPTSLSRDTTYSWRILFVDLGGLTGAFCPPQSFRIGDDFEFGVRPGSTNHSRKCWVATAAFQSEEAPPILALQDYRSDVLEKSAAGRCLAHLPSAGAGVAPAFRNAGGPRTLISLGARTSGRPASSFGLILVTVLILFGARRLTVR